MPHKHWTILFLLAFLTIATPVRAQQMQAKLSHYTTDDGLSSNAISFMGQDDYGYIWVATWNGLTRFDGYNFYNYQTGNSSRIPLLHNRIMDLAIDNQQNVWLRMYDGRIFVLKRNIDRIINPFEGINGYEEFRTSYPLFVTSSGDVLVTINNVGLYKMHAERDEVKTQLITTGGLTITSMAEGYQNDIWLGTDKGVHRMDVSNLTIERKGYFLDEHITCLYSNGYNIYVGTESGKILTFAYGQSPTIIRNGGFSLTSLFVDSHGSIWFADKRMGATRLDPKTGVEKLYQQRVVVPDHDGRGGVFNERNGIVWVRMNQGGYGYYNRESDEVEYFHNDPSNPWNLSNTVNATLELNEGVIWETTSRRGLEKLEILKNTITRTLLVPDANAYIENEIRAMYYDTARKLTIMGNKNSQIFLIREDGSRTIISKDSNGQPLARIYGISKDSKGTFWVCSKDNGLYALNIGSGDNYTMKNYHHDPDNKWSMSSNSAYVTVEDRDGNIWVATYGGGVNILTKNKNGQEIFLNKMNSMKNYPFNSHQKVRTLAIDADGNVWAGTTDGILVMSYKDKKLKIERLKPSEEDPDHLLQSNDVVCLVRDNRGSMWVGTNGGGLAHTIGKDSKGCWLFENFGAKDGLPSEEIHSITIDLNGNVWFATDHILCSYDVGKKIFTTFSNLDGVDETMCSEGGALTLPNGNILFGTLNGYYTIDKKKLVNSAGSMLKLRFTDFWLNDEQQSPRFNENYSYYVPDSREVTLPSHNAMFSMRFASLNYQLQHRVHYQYTLEGYDHQWYNASRSRIVSYSDLPTGTYRLKVKAFLLESPEKYDQKEIAIIVPPYFMLSSNAIWIYMILSMVISIWFLLWKQKRMAAREKLRRLNTSHMDTDYADDAEQQFMKAQLDWLEEHYAESYLTVDDLIESSGIDPVDYKEQIRLMTKLTPKEFMLDFRIKKACDLLVNTNDSMAEVAFKTGFKDVHAFTRNFTASAGISPSKYRDKNRKTDEYEIIED